MYFASNNVFINLILRGSDFWLCTIQVTKHIIAISNLHTAKKKGAPRGFMPVSALSLKWWMSCKWWLLRKIGKQRLILTQTVISIAPLCLVPVQRKDSLFSQGSYPGQPMLPGAGLGSEAGDRVWNAKTKIKPEDCSPVLDRLVIHRPDHADCSRISYLSRQVFCCVPTKMLFHSPLSLSFPGQSSSVTQAGPTLPKHGSRKSISLKSHHSSDFERCLECTDTAICCDMCTDWRLSVLCQRAPDPRRIPVAKPWQVREYSHSFSSLHKLAKATSCSSGLSRAPGQGDYFFPGSYTPITLRALSINKVENPKSKQGWKPSGSTWFGMQP